MNSPDNYGLLLANGVHLKSYISFSLSLLDSMPNKNHHLIPAAISLKNLRFGDAPSQTYARTENPNDTNTFVASIVQGYNCAAVKPVEAKYAKG